MLFQEYLYLIFYEEDFPMHYINENNNNNNLINKNNLILLEQIENLEIMMLQ